MAIKEGWSGNRVFLPPGTVCGVSIAVVQQGKGGIGSFLSICQSLLKIRLYALMVHQVKLLGFCYRLLRSPENCGYGNSGWITVQEGKGVTPASFFYIVEHQLEQLHHFLKSSLVFVSSTTPHPRIKVLVLFFVVVLIG